MEAAETWTVVAEDTLEEVVEAMYIDMEGRE
jgi:hypothetical protein